MGLLPEPMGWEMEDDDGLLHMGSKWKRGFTQVEKMGEVGGDGAMVRGGMLCVRLGWSGEMMRAKRG